MAVYFIQNEEGLVKIGHSKNPFARIKVLNVASARPLRLARVVEGGPAVEAWLHRKFAKLHVSGEWFHYHSEMESIIVPDEIPVPQILKSRPKTIAEFFANADKLELLSEQERLELSA